MTTQYFRVAFGLLVGLGLLMSTSYAQEGASPIASGGWSSGGPNRTIDPVDITGRIIVDELTTAYSAWYCVHDAMPQSVSEVVEAGLLFYLPERPGMGPFHFADLATVDAIPAPGTVGVFVGEKDLAIKIAPTADGHGATDARVPTNHFQENNPYYRPSYAMSALDSARGTQANALAMDWGEMLYRYANVRGALPTSLDDFERTLGVTWIGPIVPVDLQQPLAHGEARLLLDVSGQNMRIATLPASQYLHFEFDQVKSEARNVPLPDGTFPDLNAMAPIGAHVLPDVLPAPVQ